MTPPSDNTSPSPTTVTTSTPEQLSTGDQPTIHERATDSISAMDSTLVPLSPAHSAQPVTSFALSPKLPIELRLKIFKSAIPTGRKGFHMLEVKVEVTEAEPDKLTNKGRGQYQ